MMPGPPPEMTEKPASDSWRAIFGQLVVRRFRRRACAAEDRHGRADLGQPLRGLDEL
jgi:hypothetical protein